MSSRASFSPGTSDTSAPGRRHGGYMNAWVEVMERKRSPQ